MRGPTAYEVREQMLSELYKTWVKHGGGDRDYYVAQPIWDQVRAKFPDGSIDGNLADRVFASLQADGSIDVVAGEGSVGVRVTEAGRDRLEDKRQLSRNAWLAYIGAATGILGLIVSIATEAL